MAGLQRHRLLISIASRFHTSDATQPEYSLSHDTAVLGSLHGYHPLTMPRIVLHIGLEKTGTTSIQRFLTKNRASLLEKHGILYPSHPALCHDEAHSTLTAALLPPSDCDFVVPEARPSMTDVLDGLDEALDLEPEALVLSSEHMSSRLDEAGISQLAQLFSRYPVEVVVYLRRQEEMGIAAFSTHLKCGRRDWLIPREISPKNHYYDFQGKLAPWAAIFGREAIKVRIFDRKQLYKEDISDDFLRTIGVQNGFEHAREAPLNRSLTLSEAALLHALNQHLPTWEEATERERPWEYYLAQQLRLEALEEVGGLPAMASDRTPLITLLTAWDRVRIRRRFQRMNARIARDYLDCDRLFADDGAQERTSARLLIRPEVTLKRHELAEILLMTVERLAERMEIPDKDALLRQLSSLAQSSAPRRRPRPDEVLDARHPQKLSENPSRVM